jgi:triacylglycerol esterase/lipase EstA (alpha/beta hydrolase family)
MFTARRAAALVTVALAFATAAPAAVAAEPLPPQGPPPPGANDLTCKPTSAHPYPVVLVHGTFANMIASWNAIAPVLRANGYCPWALDYGYNATQDIAKSAGQLQTFIDQVLQKTGASKVDIVGHSQGGMMPRYYIKYLGGDTKVNDLIGLSPSNNGTTNPLVGPAGAGGCVACRQQAAGSPFLQDLNAGGYTKAGIDYTVIETKYDEVVTPYTSEFLPDASNVTNVLLQSKCPADITEHVGVIYDPVAIQWMLNALGRSGPADAAFKPTGC